MDSVYEINICGVKRKLPIIKISDNLAIASFVILGDTELIVKTAPVLAGKLPQVDVLVTAEAKGIPLVYEVSKLLNMKEYIIARKSVKPYMVIMGPGLKSIIIALTVCYWVTMARIVRGQIMSLKQQEFVLAAKTIGVSPMKIILKHLIPNCMGPIIVTLTLTIPDAIFTESFLSFIGLGVSAPQASWGTLASESLQSFQMYPSLILFPSLAICLTILAFNFLGDGLRDALDPKMRK